VTLYSPAIITLPNELQLITVERPYGKTFALALTFRVGSFNDPPGLEGLAHFCEHLAFRGPNREFAETLTRLGAAVNGFTAYEYTAFSVRGHIEHFELGLKFIANILQPAPRCPAEVAAEQSVFRHELSQDELSTREAAVDHFWRATLGDPHWRITRKEQRSNIRRLTADVVNPFLLAHHHPANARLSVVAPMDHKAIHRSLEALLPPAANSKRSENDPPKHYIRPPRRITTSIDRFGYPWLYFNYVAEQTDAVTRLTAAALAHRLGRGPHSELFRRLRRDRPLAYSIYADDLLHLRRTAIYCYTSVPPRSVKHALEILLECENDIRTHGFADDDLKAIKHRMILAKEMYLDYPEHLAAHLAYEALRPPDEALLLPDEYVQRISTLTLAEVNDAARAILSPTNRFTFIGGRVGLLKRWHIRHKLR
jgi:predicted Zn-dependent peptidase